MRPTRRPWWRKAAPRRYTFKKITPLPLGLALNAKTGVISGIPKVSGTTNVTIQVTDKALVVATRTWSLTINPVSPAVHITTSTLPDGTWGAAYSQTLAAAGGTAPYTFKKITPLPSGLVLAATTGVISGIPKVSGTTNVTIQVTDKAKVISTRTLAITINPVGPAVHIMTPSLPSATKGHDVHARPGGRRWYGALHLEGRHPRLPSGLSLNATTGSISGTPKAIGTTSP